MKKILTVLLIACVNILYADDEEELAFAIENSDLKRIERFVKEKKIDLNKVIVGKKAVMTPLEYAIFFIKEDDNKLKTLKVLVSNGALPTHKDLIVSIRFGYYEVAKYLIQDVKVDVNGDPAKDESPLVWAMGDMRKEFVELLLNSKAKVNFVFELENVNNSKEKLTPMDLAIKLQTHGFYIVELLKKYKAKTLKELKQK